MNIEQMITYDEGVENKLYRCSENFWTIGIGHMVTRENCSKERAIKILDSQIGRATGGAITSQEISSLFAIDLVAVERGIRQSAYSGVYERLDDARKMALTNMTFQLGTGGVSKFKKFLAALDRKDWVVAEREGFDSLWARQTPNRARRVMSIIRNGDLKSYR